MVSTYLSYNMVTRDLQTSLKRVANDSQVAANRKYYEENIGKVKTVDDFMGDYRLYSYAMKAYGLEDMTYAKAFMQKVLESDLSDQNSFANKLTDSRYRDFAQAFNFKESGATAQTSVQTDTMLGLYTQTMADQGDAVTTDSKYFSSMMDQIGNVNDLLNDDRLRQYLFKSYGIDDNYYSRDLITGVLSSDTSDPNSYINKTLGPQKDAVNAQLQDAQTRYNAATNATDQANINAEIQLYSGQLASLQKYYDMADAFQFNADGSVPAGGAQTAAQKVTINDLYLSKQDRLSTATALNETAYFKQQMSKVTGIGAIFADDRLYSYIKTAFNQGPGVTSDMIASILKSDLSDPNSYANVNGKADPNILAMAKAFNFRTDGTVDAGQAVTDAQLDTISNGYYSFYNDNQDAADDKAAQLYKTALADVKSVDTFLSTANVRDFALKAIGVDPTTVSNFELRKILTSDLSDKNSYVNTLGDDRYVTLVKAFNFNSSGDVSTPLTAQSTGVITAIGSDYTIQKTRFLTGTDLDKAKSDASTEVGYYSEQMQKIQNVTDFVNDDRLVNVLLTSYGIDPKSVTKDFLKQVFTSDLNSSSSFANQQTNSVWAEMRGSLNFDASGNLSKADSVGIQTKGKLLETENKYNRQSLEEIQGEANNGVRLALYFERMSKTITSAYDILADGALAEFFRVTFQLPDSIGSLNVDKQAELVQKYMPMEDMKDPDKVKKLINKFTALYDMQNSSASSSALSILNGSAGSSGISSDTLAALNAR
ncbi:DUF1217 domain-containing protein [Rhizobium oryzicola]|uniref:DUF1217 domain-containing protein n=1 Tax=Rhizobium oryzicola TaxID=1232668 RepID=A0ABT8SSE4_9HYPH|nr:DUF1217 domain-containing protein [Rhizobium oryzicola]MDO1581236.1 DUF1217 domain-containing protein [Rhizobium oryzicola]